jgi:hypothetical protein
LDKWTRKRRFWELLNSHSEELTDDDLLLFDQQRAFEEADIVAEEAYTRL